MSQQLPVRIARPLHRQCLFPRAATRPFSSTIAHRKQAPMFDPAYVRATANNTPEKAPQTLHAQMLEQQRGLIDDIGLLPGTFVRAWGSAPKLIPSPAFPLSKEKYRKALGDRWKYEYSYVKAKLGDVKNMGYYKWLMRRSNFKDKPKHVFLHRLVKGKAGEYYGKAYTSFANKDQDAIEKICLSGLSKSLADRIEARPGQVEMQWELIKGATLPRVVSNRMTPYPIPGADDKDTPSAIRQVIIRFKTRQRLTVIQNAKTTAEAAPSGYAPKYKKKPLAWTPHSDAVEEVAEQESPNTPTTEVHEHDVVEYVVMQKRMLHGEEEDWKLQGFADATTLEVLLEDEAQQKIAEDYDMANPSQ